MNYSELVSAIQDYTENTFSNADINIFIKQAEQRIYNTVQLPALRKNVTGNTTASNKYLAAPSDWLATFSMAIVSASGSYSYLLNKDVNFIRAAYPEPTDTGAPEYYALFDQNTFILGPTPNSSYTVELHYFYYPESIVTANTTWLGNNFDSALLYGSLLEAYTYMKGESDMVALYKQRYDEALALLKQLGDGKDRQDAYRSGQVRYKVQ
ncbi:MAG: hypothetical protein EBR82_39800 [Caulobacteraceae bacterium]|nr:hypothetical protein [Caulobacteraceae bacterium]